MKYFPSILIAAVSAAAFATSAAAIPTYATVPSAQPMDCAKAKDKARCEALNKDIRACRDKTDDEWRDCMRRPLHPAAFTPPRPRDCANARNKERCEIHRAALQACKGKAMRPEHRRCMSGQLRAPEKS